MSEQISVKKPARYEKDAAIQAAFNDIYKHINEIIDSVNSVGTDVEGEGSGKEGDMRVVQKSDQNVSLEVRVEDGWYESQLFDTNPDISTTTIAALTGVDGSGSNAAPLTATNAAIVTIVAKLNEVINLIQEMNVSGFKILDRRHQ